MAFGPHERPMLTAVIGIMFAVAASDTGDSDTHPGVYGKLSDS